MLILSHLRPAFLVSVCAFHLAGGTGHAAFSGHNGKLVFSSLVDGDKNVVAAEATSGSPWQRLTTHPAEDAQPAWSPDGSSVAFRARRPGHYYEIYVVGADGSGERRLTTTPAPSTGAQPYSTQPSWSPDGQRIVFRSNRDGDPDVWVMDADGTNARQVADDPADERYPGFSPDGSRVAFTSTRDGDTEIYTMALDGGDVRQLTSNGIYDSAPAWSPDGARLAFERGSAGDHPTNEVWTMSAAGGDERRLTDNDVLDEGPAWSPDGTRLAFTSTRLDGLGDIFVMNPDGSDQHVVAASAKLEESPDWQRREPPPAAPGEAPSPQPGASDDASFPPSPDASSPPPALPGGSAAASPQVTIPRRIALRTLLRRGLPVTVSCDRACRVTVRVRHAGLTIARRTFRAGRTPVRARVRTRRRFIARLRGFPPSRLAVRVVVTIDGNPVLAAERRVRVSR